MSILSLEIADFSCIWKPMPGKLTPSGKGSRCSKRTVLPSHAYKLRMEKSSFKFGSFIISFLISAHETRKTANSFEQRGLWKSHRLFPIVEQVKRPIIGEFLEYSVFISFLVTKSLKLNWFCC
ncbi:Hypothetical_protein [Hexamita inflata]|uniref:Hypothetical_protein n=1 Tax=Hexamita inflata TaxID=28002 RepID=A0AA86NY82_9EUKA|nr:Hypothetical protein HINF_LOCUS15883 [Hexamita inflata]